MEDNVTGEQSDLGPYFFCNISYTVLTISTDFILGTRKCAPCQERVIISFKLQEAIEAVKPTDL